MRGTLIHSRLLNFAAEAGLMLRPPAQAVAQGVSVALLLCSPCSGQTDGAKPSSPARKTEAVLPASKDTPAPKTPPKARREVKSVEQIAEQIKPSLVSVTQVGRDGPFGVGSGFAVGDDLIATNRHVIGEARRILVETSDRRSLEVTEIVANDARLDLAILRVSQKGLKALPLGDSDSMRQGQPIVAMGNPAGLSFSVVDGVISEPSRDVDGMPMIQIAIPIERGNSGGPLVDRQGRVLGVLTLKSARTKNLGFAMPVNALKKLVEHPNPIPMERWLTIGVLNPRLWTTLMGAQWTQRAGMIQVAQSGQGFGGRSLCLWTETPQPDVFEASVTVKLGDEAGAAGLAFCADGGDRHYGFYPTAGKLRLTRFDGPDVYSWKILEELASDAYLPEEWNTLRVRVEGARIRCFVNGRQVVDREDSGLRGGLAGLCKFRATSASYKNFRVGSDVSEKPLPPELEKNFKGVLEDLLAKRVQPAQAVDALVSEAEANRSLLLKQQGELEKASKMLKDMAVDLHQRSVREALVAELEKPEAEADLLRCALLISKHDNPDLDTESYRRGFAQMADELSTDEEVSKGTESAVRRLNKYLFEENGFHGSRSDYSSRSNSYVNEVLDDREGLPITLSIVYMELARRLGVEGVVGIPLPGRFMVGYRASEQDEFSLVDVYDGGKVLSMREALEIVSDGALVPEKARQPALKRDIVVRMIRNLAGPQLEARNGAQEALPYLDLLIALDPDAGRERLSRAMIREFQGNRSGAAEDVGWMLEHLPEGIRANQREMLEEWLRKLTR
jgi:regulator of sirC expression with transglutaminase-like and TPR domain